ncbi:alpha-L-rhamnosidase [Cohaesibacter celericrescens]|uniref:alpha-L-rhamnosidase n=2 Tax=Cohaesibacter celericrescens TaxID=2067669 RepID=A0A2N5XQU8_9HYPH|nr:alpha-L-rhamnosidase [Cohaesibacter celericrescens]
MFGWALEANQSPEDSHFQTAWRIVAGTSRDDVLQGLGALWDSGKTIGPQTNMVRWGGDALPSDMIMWWSVQVWDETDTPSCLAEPARVFTGLKASDWQASWIGRYFVLPAGRDVPQDALYDNRFQARPADYLRKEHALVAKPIRATAYVSALGLYELYINGMRIGENVMAPGWTDYHQRAEYHALDVTEAFFEGDNCIGAIIGEGWYSGRIGHNQRRAGNHYGGRPALLCQVHIEFADGRVECIVSDETWSTRQGPICYSDFLAGEMFDARLELEGWCAPDCDLSHWQPVEQIDPEPRLPQLDAARCEPTREVARLAPCSITALSDSVSIYDFGQNLAGYVELEVEAREGTEFRLRHGERLDNAGQLYTENLRYAVSEDIFIAAGRGGETFKPRFTFHGFQYVELTIIGPVTSPPKLTSIAIQTDTPQTGQIKTGNTMLNQLLSNIFWSQRSNFISVPTDCPQRDERYGWTADAQVFWRTAGYFMDTSAFLTKWMEDMIDGQSPEGAFPDVAPTKPLNPYRLTPQPGAPAWGDAPIIMGWQHYLRYGDHALLERCWQPFKAWMTYVEAENPDGIRRNQLNNNYGDWLTIGPETNRELINTAYWIYLADLMAKIARVLDRDAEPWLTRATRMRAAFAGAFIEKNGHLKSDTQTAYLLALDFDVLPSKHRSQAVSRLIELINEADGHLQTGFLGVRHLCPVLSDNGAEKLAVDLLLKETYPSWGFSIRHGATSIWERWDGWTQDKGFQSKAMNSFNHYAYGAVGEWIWSRLAGIDWYEEKPGYQRVQMRPIFDPRIGRVEAAYEAQSGCIKSSWRYEDEVIYWTITLPPGVDAQVLLPVGMMTEQGAQFALAPGHHTLKVTATKTMN